MVDTIKGCAEISLPCPNHPALCMLFQISIIPACAGCSTFLSSRLVQAVTNFYHPGLFRLFQISINRPCAGCSKFLSTRLVQAVANLYHPALCRLFQIFIILPCAGCCKSPSSRLVHLIVQAVDGLPELARCRPVQLMYFNAFAFE